MNLSWTSKTHGMLFSGRSANRFCNRATDRFECGATWAELDIALDALGSLDDLPETRVVLDGSTDLERMDFSSLVATNDLGRLTASGSAGWVPTPTFDIEYALSDLDPSLASDLLQGRINASGKASGTLGEDTHTLAVTVRELGGLINGQLLAGGGAFTHTPDRLVVDGQPGPAWREPGTRSRHSGRHAVTGRGPGASGATGAESRMRPAVSPAACR